MLPKTQRISRKEFPEILKSKTFSHSSHFGLRTLPHSTQAKVSVTVSKKVSKSAVVRNKVRRRVYSAIPKVSPGHYLIVAKPGAEKIKGEQLQNELALLFKKR